MFIAAPSLLYIGKYWEMIMWAFMIERERERERDRETERQRDAYYWINIGFDARYIMVNKTRCDACVWSF